MTMIQENRFLIEEYNSVQLILRIFIRRHASLWTSKVTQKGSDVHRIIIQSSNILMDQHQATTMSTMAFHGQKSDTW